jgi:hypothetical protein
MDECEPREAAPAVEGRRRAHGVAVQVAFESKGLKPLFHFTGPRVVTRRFQAMGKLDSTCTSPKP